MRLKGWEPLFLPPIFPRAGLWDGAGAEVALQLLEARAEIEAAGKDLLQELVGCALDDTNPEGRCLWGSLADVFFVQVGVTTIRQGTVSGAAS